MPDYKRQSRLRDRQYKFSRNSPPIETDDFTIFKSLSQIVVLLAGTHLMYTTNLLVTERANSNHSQQ